MYLREKLNTIHNDKIRCQIKIKRIECTECIRFITQRLKKTKKNYDILSTIHTFHSYENNPTLTIRSTY